ncbi:MAG: PilN domain-containing protein [Campylobacterales bacterium]
MKYSLTHPRPKQLLSADTKLWWVFIAGVLFVFVLVKAVVSIHTAGVNQESEQFKQERAAYEAKIAQLETDTRFVLEEAELVSRVLGRNKVIKDSLINLFDLVPDQIYLTDLEISAKTMRIKGYTPSKEVFNYLLRPPLESIFQRTEVSFFPVGNGWFAFDCLSISEEAFIYDKR